jgi:hypothetical protein
VLEPELKAKSEPKKSKAYQLLPKHLQEIAPISLLLSEASSGPTLSVPMGFMLAVGFPSEVEIEYRRHTARPFVDHEAT